MENKCTYHWWLLSFFITIVTACSGGGEELDEPAPTPSQPNITLPTSTSDFSAEGGSNTISFSSSAPWTASVINSRADSWCSVSPTSGPAGNANITITTMENDTPDDRSASVVIKAGSAQKAIKVSQKQKDALTVTSKKFEVSADGGEVKIEIKANIDYTYTIDEKAKSWITSTGSRALKTSTLVFKVASNDELEKREGSITISSGAIQETVTIYQSGTQPVITLTKNEYVVSADGDVICVEVNSNVDVDVEMPADAAWVSEDNSRAMSTNTYYFKVAASDEYEQRSAEIKFTNKANGLSESVMIVQAQKDALVIAKNSYTVVNEGGEITIEVGHNVDFDIEITDNWITRKETASRAFVTDELVFVVANNEGYDNRESSIKFTSKDESITQIVKVYQAQKNALVVSRKNFVVSDEGGRVEIEVQSNVNFTVSGPDVDWIHETTESRALTKYTLVYMVDANETYESREAQLIIKDESNANSEIVTITQSQKDALVIAKNSYSIGSDGGQLQLELGHNVDFDVTIDVDWISYSISRAYQTSTLSFTVAENTTYDNRSGNITFTSKDGSLTQTVKVEQASKDALIIGNKEVSLGAESGTFSIELQSNVEFTVSEPDVDWLHAIVTRGLTSHTLNYSYDANETYHARSASIVITDTKNNRSEVVTITQSQKDAIVIGRDSYSIGSEGGQLQLEVGHNIDFDVTIDVDWITQSVSRSYQTSALSFTVAENTTYDNRSGNITFTSKDGSLTQTVKVEQASKDALIIGNKEVSLGAESGTFSIELQSNVEFTVSEPDVDWLHAIVTRGLTSHTLNYSYDANETYHARSASIVITDTKNNRSEVVTITQSQKDAIVIGRDSYSIGSEGGQLQLEVGHNIDFDVTIDVDWISQSVSRSYQTSTLSFTVAENTTYDNRSGNITFTSKDGSLTQTVKVEQASKDALIIGNKEVSLGAESGTFSIELQSNVEFTVSEPDVDWLHAIVTRGLTSHTLNYSYDANETYHARSASIVITDTKNNRSEVVTITQSQKDAIVIGRDSYSIGSEGGQLQLEVGHNIDFDVTIDVDWITQSVSRSYQTSALSFTVAENTTYDNRSGNITFTSKDGSISQIVTVEQTQSDALIVSNKEVSVDSWGGTFSFEVATNVEFTVSVLDADWLRPLNYTPSRGLSYHYPVVQYDENTSYESRVGKILVTDIKNNKSDTITVTQAQRNALIVGKTNYQMDSKGGQLNIEVGHNVEFDVTIDVDWIKQSFSRSFGTSDLVFNVESNPDYNSRWGYITFTSKDGSISQTVTVEQTEADALIVGNKEFLVDSWSGQFSFEVAANVDFTVSVLDADWLRSLNYNPSRGLSYYYPIIEYDENTSYESRVGKILVTDVKNNKSDTIIVTQAPKDAIVLTEKNYKVDSKSGQLQIKVSHNVEFDVSIDVPWITQSVSRSMGSSTLIFNVAENPEFKEREGTITFTSKNGTVTQKVKVLQLKNKSFDPSIDDWEDDEEHSGSAE